MNSKFIVAIGYSEGGLKPLLSFFDHVPHDQATYIILRHVPMDQRGALTEILHRHSKLDIKEVEDGTIIENDVVYIPPSAYYTIIKGNKLYLKSRAMDTRTYNCSIDSFLQSLAKEKGKKSMAVILSGRGTDGVEGAIEIQKSGGLVIVQDPATCSHPQMPARVVETGCAYKILAPAEMPDFITKYAHPILKNANLARRL